MKIVYDKETDVLNIFLRDDKIIESDEARENVIIDLNKDGEIVALEILDASKHIADLSAMKFEVAKFDTIC